MKSNEKSQAYVTNDFINTSFFALYKRGTQYEFPKIYLRHIKINGWNRWGIVDDADASKHLSQLNADYCFNNTSIAKNYSAKRSPLISGATGVIFGFNCPKSAPAGARPSSGI